MAARREKLMSPAMIQPTKAVRHPFLGYSAAYKIVSNAEETGKYNCYKQKWTSSGWANVSTTNYVCVVENDSGHTMSAGDFLVGRATANSNNEIPAEPLDFSLIG